MFPVHPYVVPERGAPLTRDRENVVVDGEPYVLPRRQEDAAVRAYELHIAPSPTELGPNCQIGVATTARHDAQLLQRDLGCPIFERFVYRRPELLACDEVEEERRGDDRQRDRSGGGYCYARPKRHDSRSAYPTPRTVWIRRGAPPSSVLRRRYPI